MMFVKGAFLAERSWNQLLALKILKWNFRAVNTRSTRNPEEKRWRWFWPPLTASVKEKELDKRSIANQKDWGFFSGLECRASSHLAQSKTCISMLIWISTRRKSHWKCWVLWTLEGLSLCSSLNMFLDWLHNLLYLHWLHNWLHACIDFMTDCIWIYCVTNFICID